MDRRLVIATVLLILLLAALAVAGLGSPAGAPAATETAGLPQPTPDRALAPGGMSGEFADRLLADAGAPSVPSV
jgi:hypothetical protein